MVNSTSITATTAAHTAGTVSVVVTNTDAQSGTLANGYTYNTSTGGGGTITFVQVNAADSADGQCIGASAFSAAQTAGNLNVVAVGWNDATSTVSSVTDISRQYLHPGGNHSDWHRDAAGDLLRQEHRRRQQHGDSRVQSGGCIPDVRIAEYSGADTSSPLDVTAGAMGTGGTPSSGAATTTSASELIFGAGMTTSHFAAAGSRLHFADNHQPGR